MKKLENDRTSPKSTKVFTSNRKIIVLKVARFDNFSYICTQIIKDEKDNHIRWLFRGFYGDTLH